MKKTIYYTMFFIMVCCKQESQAQETTYYGSINGSTIELTLNKTGELNYSGTLKDEQQTYTVLATRENDCFSGNALEKQLNINLPIKGCFKDDNIEMHIDFSNYGVTELQRVVLSQKKAEHKTVSTNTNKENRDSRLVGLWKQEQLYNSGYGDNSFGGSYTQKAIFYADGSMADAGSETYISGNDYSGNSTTQGSNKVPGVSWHTKNNHLFFTVSQNGQSQTTNAGKYYIDNGRMLITDANGNKTLLLKVNN